MNRKGIVLFLLLCSAWGWSQDAVAVFEESVYNETTTTDSITHEHLVSTTDILTDLHIIVEESTTDSASYPSIDTTLSPASTTTPQRISYTYYWSDVKHLRDSLQQAMHAVRDSMRMGIRNMRDSVRNDLTQTASKHPHMLRIGCGDQLFESLVWYGNPYFTLYPESFIGEYNENYRYTQHWFIEYQYRIKYWFNFGAMVDYSGVLWDRVQRNGKGDELHRENNKQFHNISLLLTLRFTYLHTKYVHMYSGLGAGLNLNTGSEIDYMGRQTVMAPALNLTVLGLSVGNERWFGSLEFGGLYSLLNSNEIYLAGSRMFTASVGVNL